MGHALCNAQILFCSAQILTILTSSAALERCASSFICSWNFTYDYLLYFHEKLMFQVTNVLVIRFMAVTVMIFYAGNYTLLKRPQ